MSENVAGERFVHERPAVDELEEVHPGPVLLHDHLEVGVVLEVVADLDNVGVVQGQEHADLQGEPGSVGARRHPEVVCQFGLFNELRNDLLRKQKVIYGLNKS